MAARDRWLTADERARAKRYPDDGDRLRFLTGRVVLRSVVGACLGVPPGQVPLDAACARCGAPHGRPRLNAPTLGLELSLAHAGDRVALAVSRGAAVGIDVEPIGTHAPDPTLATAALAECERQALMTLPERDRAAGLNRCWTRKEAVLKADGRGMTVGPASVVVSGPGQSPELQAAGLEPPLPGPVWLCDLDLQEAYAASLAVLSRAAPSVRQRWWEAPGHAGTPPAANPPTAPR